MHWALIGLITAEVTDFCHKHGIPMGFYDNRWAEVPARVYILNMLQGAGFEVRIV